MPRLTLFFVLCIPALADWLEKHQRGERLLQEGKAGQALLELKAALAEADPAGKGAILDSLGRAEYQAGNYREAKKRFEISAMVFEGEPLKRAVVLVNAGHAYQALGELAHAELVFREALDAMPREAMIWQNLGQVLFLQHHYRDAEAALRMALSLAEPQLLAPIWNDLAMLHEAQRQVPKAAEMLRNAAAAAAPGQARARIYANLGVLLWKLKAKNAAVAQIRLALSEMESAVGDQHPDVAKILEDYRDVLQKMGRKAEAGALAERAASIRSLFAGQTNDHRASVDWRDLK